MDLETPQHLLDEEKTYKTAASCVFNKNEFIGDENGHGLNFKFINRK